MHYCIGSAAEYHCASQGSVLILDLPPSFSSIWNWSLNLQPSRAQSTPALKPNVKIQNIKAQAQVHTTPQQSHECLSKTTSQRCRFVRRTEHKAVQCRIPLFGGGKPCNIMKCWHHSARASYISAALCCCWSWQTEQCQVLRERCKETAACLAGEGAAVDWDQRLKRTCFSLIFVF